MAFRTLECFSKKIPKVKILLIPLFTVLFLFCKAGTKDSLEYRVFDLIYCQEYASADSLLRKAKPAIDPIYFAVLHLDLKYWQHITGTSEPNYKAFENILSSYEQDNSRSHNNQVKLLIASSYKLRYELKRFKLFDAINTRKKTLILFDQLKTETTELKAEEEALLDLYSALISYFNYFLKPFFINGKKKEMAIALQEMTALSKSINPITSTLASYFVGKILLRYEKQAENARGHLVFLCNRYPENMRFKELLLDCEDQMSR